MIPLSEVTGSLRRNLLDLKFALEREVRLSMEAAAKHARSLIGEEQPGWDALAESTLEEKARLGYPTPAPLLREGDLRDSIKGEAETTLEGVKGVVGSTDPIAIYHEAGTSRMPPRPFLAPSLMLAEPEIATTLGKLAVRALTPGEKP